MRLYHGSNIVIDSINLAMCRPYKDFGKGFYLTDIKEQAENMAVRVSKIYGGSPVVNTFEIQDDFRKIEDIKVKDFGLETTEEWAKFVMNNRNRTFTHLHGGDQQGPHRGRHHDAGGKPQEDPLDGGAQILAEKVDGGRP